MEMGPEVWRIGQYINPQIDVSSLAKRFFFLPQKQATLFRYMFFHLAESMAILTDLLGFFFLFKSRRVVKLS